MSLISEVQTLINNLSSLDEIKASLLNLSVGFHTSISGVWVCRLSETSWEVRSDGNARDLDWAAENVRDISFLNDFNAKNLANW